MGEMLGGWTGSEETGEPFLATHLPSENAHAHTHRLCENAHAEAPSARPCGRIKTQVLVGTSIGQTFRVACGLRLVMFTQTLL